MRSFHPFLHLFLLLFLASALRAQPNWQVAPSNFQYTMTVIGVAVYDCTENTDENDLVAAFINNEIRGVQSFGTDALGRKYAYLIIFDNVFSGNEVSFKLWDASEDVIVDVLATTVFSENGSVGGFDTPFLFNTTYALENLSLSSEIIAADATAGQPVAALSATNENGDVITPAFSFIDDAQGVDNSFFSINGSNLVLEEDVNTAVKTQYQIHLAGTTTNGCTMNQAFLLLVEGTTSTADYQVTGRRLITYPNPLTGNQLNVESDKKTDRVNIYSPAGQLLQQHNIRPGQKTIDVSGLQNGLYILTFRMEGGGWISQKLIVSRRA